MEQIESPPEGIADQNHAVLVINDHVHGVFAARFIVPLAILGRVKIGGNFGIDAGTEREALHNKVTRTIVGQ